MKTNFLYVFKRSAPSFISGGVLTLGIYLFVVAGNFPDHDYASVKETARFRKWYAFRRGQGVQYDIVKFKKFIDSFDTLKYSAMNPKNPHNDGGDYKWVIGFYWTRKTDSTNRVKYDFCIIPTLTIKGVVQDYFEDRDKLKKNPALCYYDHTYDDTDTRKTITITKGQSNAYDNGGLWP